MVKFRRTLDKNVGHVSKTRCAIRRGCTTIGVGIALLFPLTSGAAFATLDRETGTTNCATGQFCYWADEDYRGAPQRLDLTEVHESVCIPLPHDGQARSFVNKRSREITLYEGGHCSTQGDFRTYPGHGTYVPEAPFVVRAVEIWP